MRHVAKWKVLNMLSLQERLESGLMILWRPAKNIDGLVIHFIYLFFAKFITV
jgi:hypothetical protein